MYYITESLLLTHCIATFGFLIAALFIPTLRKVIPTFLSTANTIAAVLALVNVIAMIVDLINAWEASPDHTFFKYRAVTYVPLIVIYVAAISLSFFRKLRTTVAFSLILLIVYSCLIFSERIYLIITSFIPDTLPSSWSYYRPSCSYILPLLAAAGYSVICYFIAVKKHARQNH
jgi:molybdopterin-containing oxidoreductase family membrane subunit